METRKEISEYLNNLIKTENGKPLKSNEPFSSAGLDSLGVTFFLMEVDLKYDLLKDVPSGSEYEHLNLSTILFKDLVNQCKLQLLKHHST